MRKFKFRQNRISSKKAGFFRIVSFFILTVFTFHLYILPAAYSVTIAEQAGSSEKKTYSQDDEFNQKTPARRAYSGSSAQKDPRLACLLSLIIPGGGQIYLKNDLKGIGFFLLTMTGYSSAGYYLYKALKDDASSEEKKSKIMISGLLYLIGLIFHVVGIVESYNDAIEINETNFYYGSGKSKNPYIARLIFR